jgi:WD40 repeat protein
MAWDVATGKQLFSRALNAALTYGIYYSQDGASLLTAAMDRPQASVMFYDAATGAHQRSISMRNTAITSFINVRHNLFGNFAGSDHVIWDITTGQVHLRLPGFTYATSYAISPDGSRIVIAERTPPQRGGESEVTLLSLRSGRRLLSLKRQETVAALAFSPDGNKLIAAFSQSSPSFKPIQIWDATPLPEESPK